MFPCRMWQLTIAVVIAVFTLSPSRCEAHSIFKRVLQERYELQSVSCNTCHVENAARTERNSVGLVFSDRLGHKHLSENFRQAQQRGFEGRREFEQIMRAEFLEVLQDVEPIRTSNGQTFGQRFRSADFNGLLRR